MNVEREKRDFLRHTLATVAYRGAKTLRGAPPEFAAFRIGETTKTPLEILGHIGDLFDWGHSLAEGREIWNDSEPLSWEKEVHRFYGSLSLFDEYLNSNSPLHVSAEMLFQGPVADALTHIGQLAMLRRLSDSPIKGENYFKAEIETGRLGLDQTDPPFEFD